MKRYLYAFLLLFITHTKSFAQEYYQSETYTFQQQQVTTTNEGVLSNATYHITVDFEHQQININEEVYYKIVQKETINGKIIIKAIDATGNPNEVMIDSNEIIIWDEGHTTQVKYFNN